MRWLGFAALFLVATGCTVHVVEQAAVPVLVAEPGHYSPRRAEARPTLPVPEPAAAPRAEAPQPVVAPSPKAIPAEPRPKRLASVRPKPPASSSSGSVSAPRARPEQKQKRLGRFKLEPNDVAPVKDDQSPEPKRTRPARSTSVAKSQQHALDLRK